MVLHIYCTSSELFIDCSHVRIVNATEISHYKAALNGTASKCERITSAMHWKCMQLLVVLVF